MGMNLQRVRGMFKENRLAQLFGKAFVSIHAQVTPVTGPLLS